MGKKKKGANKLSDEERARYLQARADIEEEARRRKQQLIALYMKVISSLDSFIVSNSQLIHLSLSEQT